MYFTYWTPTNDPAFKNTDAIIDRQGRRTPQFERVKRVNAAINAWAPTLMNLKSTGVYHTGELPRETTALPANATIKIEGTSALLLGAFKHQDGSDWWMVMNRDMQNRASTILKFNGRIRRVRELSSTGGTLSSNKLRNGEASISLNAGEAKMFKLYR